ncbi:hypothetical protein DPEC_G00361720 [Dallia pectoralis]|nr:hypothetical protein DPEC_G00361720 [Dallia pectoralis]
MPKSKHYRSVAAFLAWVTCTEQLETTVMLGGGQQKASPRSDGFHGYCCTGCSAVPVRMTACQTTSSKVMLIISTRRIDHSGGPEMEENRETVAASICQQS